MKVAAAYIRVSTDDQIEFSPDSQLEKIKLYAERNQILLPKEFIFMDEGISGRNTKKRTAFSSRELNHYAQLHRRQSPSYLCIHLHKD